MNITEATKRALQEPNLDEALSWICVWESERAIDQARFRYGSGADGQGWDTLFGFCIKQVMDAWNERQRQAEEYPNF